MGLCAGPQTVSGPRSWLASVAWVEKASRRALYYGATRGGASLGLRLGYAGNEVTVAVE